jgi:ABC-type amino acid transport substrate-binding protein
MRANRWNEKGLALCAVAALLLPASGLQAQTELIAFGGSNYYPPFHYLDDSGDATGFDVQVLRAAVAEGVEDEDTVALLVQKGCDVLQGYCICRPMPADEFVNFSEDFNRQSVQPFAG